MIVITKNKRVKEYQMPEMPNFESRILRVAWFRKQTRESVLLNVKSVSVQVRDIKQMIYSRNPRLLSLYSRLNFTNYNDEDYIMISKTKEINKLLIYALMTADWLTNTDDIANKSSIEIEQECNQLENEINKLDKYKQEGEVYSTSNVYCRIKLLQYKLFCLKEYNSKNIEIDNKKTRVRVLDNK